MNTLFLFVLVCTDAANCPKEPIISSEVKMSFGTCRQDAEKIATAMHYKQGGDWSWKCFEASYKPKEIK